MNSIDVFILVFVFAFVGGITLARGRFRLYYLLFLTVVIAAAAIDRDVDLRSRFVNVFFPDHRSLAPKPPVAVSAVKSFRPFYVYQDKNSRNHFTPSGYMPDGSCVSVDDGWQYDVQEGQSCIRIVYDVDCSRKRQGWGGLYWQNPANNWGSQEGGYDLRGATKFVFWAKGERGGERIKEFKVGGIGARQIYPDSTAVIFKDVVLTNEWKEYTIDLHGRDLHYISGGFAWSTNAAVNPGPCVFYLDNIRFE